MAGVLFDRCAFKVYARWVTGVGCRCLTGVYVVCFQVYMGCILQTKKRYVGYMFEEASQQRAVLDTKGIEIVRRDSCPAVAKVLQQSLVTLFETRNLSTVREFCQRQFTRILANRVSIQDFMFAREVRLGSYRTATVPPAALVAAKCMAQDPRMEPARGERVCS
jgi:DNA polymerase zeta